MDTFFEVSWKEVVLTHFSRIVADDVALDYRRVLVFRSNPVVESPPAPISNATRVPRCLLYFLCQDAQDVELYQ